MNHTFYVAPTPGQAGLYDLRQTRFRQEKKRHPHDICATGFTPEGMRDLVAKYKFDADLSALPGEQA